MSTLHILPNGITVSVPKGTNLLQALQDSGMFLDAPCGGQGQCGKCIVSVQGKDVLSCQTTIESDMTIIVPENGELHTLHCGIELPYEMNPLKKGTLLAVDIGTTSVVCFLLDGETGYELSSASALNVQTSFGADVISRIRAALAGDLDKERDAIREELTDLITTVCKKAGINPEDIGIVSVVGNPTMQQLFMGISPENLASIPFAPVLTEAKAIPCVNILPVCKNAELLVVPNISGYIGSDTIGCVLSTGMYTEEPLTLIVDIGTNGEMVLGNKEHMIACSTAAGPALEGANIQFGMRGTEGAIDHVWLANGNICYSVIGGGAARGICGSGLIDAVAVLLETGLLNKRGRLQSSQERDGQRVIDLRDGVYLTQEDIRQAQLAKGSICAGIQLMAKQLGYKTEDIAKVMLAGAFGCFMNPESACRIGLLPEELRGKITAVGNAAGSGARLLACDRNILSLSQALIEKIEFLELASLPEFSRTFAKAMTFREAKR